MVLRTVVLVALLGCGCHSSNKGDPYKITRDLKIESETVTALPRDGADYASAKPGIEIVGSTGPLAQGMRKTLEVGKLSSKGQLQINVNATPASPGSTGTLDVKLSIVAVFAHSPQVSRLTATIVGKVVHTGTSTEQLGAELGDAIESWLAREKLPSELGPPAKPTTANAIAMRAMTCTRHEDKTVWCWGPSGAPIQIPEVTGSISISGDCGVRGDGRAYCIDAHDFKVRDVCGIRDASAVSTDQSTGCALLEDGTVKCWALHNESFEPCDKRTAVAVTGIENATAIDVGAFRGCAIVKDGAVRCWEHCGPDCKSGIVGQVDGSPTSTMVKGLGKATTVHVSFAVCAAAGKQVTCVDEATPRSVVLPETVTRLAGTIQETCALVASGRIFCWAAAIDAPKPAPLALENVLAFDAHHHTLCAATTTGVHCTPGGSDGKATDATKAVRWDPLESTCRHASLSIL